jgi:hypothetical protein
MVLVTQCSALIRWYSAIKLSLINQAPLHKYVLGGGEGEVKAK